MQIEIRVQLEDEDSTQVTAEVEENARQASSSATEVTLPTSEPSGPAHQASLSSAACTTTSAVADQAAALVDTS